MNWRDLNLRDSEKTFLKFVELGEVGLDRIALLSGYSKNSMAIARLRLIKLGILEPLNTPKRGDPGRYKIHKNIELPKKVEVNYELAMVDFEDLIKEIGRRGFIVTIALEGDE